MDEWPIWFLEFNIDLKPYMLNWGHYFWLEWIKSMYKDSERRNGNNQDHKSPIVWYMCKQKHFVTDMGSLEKEIVVKK